jgi:transposase
VAGTTDMRKAFDSLAAQAQTVVGKDPLSGHVFCFRGRPGDLIKLLWWNGDGLCLFAKRLERGRFVWRAPQRGWRCRHGRDYRCCWRGSTGGSRSASANPSWPDEPCDRLTRPEVERPAGLRRYGIIGPVTIAPEALPDEPVALKRIITTMARRRLLPRRRSPG